MRGGPTPPGSVSGRAGGGDNGAVEDLRQNATHVPLQGLDWTTPLLFVLMVLLYHQLVGFY